MKNIYPISLKKKHRAVCVCFFFFFAMVSCTKQVNQPAAALSPTSSVTNFHISESNLVLLEGNSANNAATFTWQGEKAANYTIEAAAHNSSFAEPIELGTVAGNQFQINVSDFNALMCRIIYANANGAVDFRVRADQAGGHGIPAYSSPVAINVSTYRQNTVYTEDKIFRVPGNYQNWSVINAPEIVSPSGNGEYEGFINFTSNYPQMLLVRGTKWDPNITFTSIGSEKFGFGGTMLSLPEGAGVYLFKANTNTNTWGYTKIKCWQLSGTAVAREINLTADNGNAVAWSVTTDLNKGSFRFNANNSKAISFGQRPDIRPGTPSYDGDDIQVRQAGNYTIRLELQEAGNYNYSIVRNR